MQIDVHHLVRQGGADVAAVVLETVVELDEVLGPRRQFDVGRVLHLAEADDHPGVGQAQMLHHRAGDPLHSEVEVLVIVEGDVYGEHAQPEGVHRVVGEPFVERGDRAADRLQMRKAVLDIAPRHRHAITPVLLGRPAPRRRRRRLRDVAPTLRARTDSPDAAGAEGRGGDGRRGGGGADVAGGVGEAGRTRWEAAVRGRKWGGACRHVAGKPPLSHRSPRPHNHRALHGPIPP